MPSILKATRTPQRPENASGSLLLLLERRRTFRAGRRAERLPARTIFGVFRMPGVEERGTWRRRRSLDIGIQRGFAVPGVDGAVFESALPVRCRERDELP